MYERTRIPYNFTSPLKDGNVVWTIKQWKFMVVFVVSPFHLSDR
jgi:hypothetical protein